MPRTARKGHAGTLDKEWSGMSTSCTGSMVVVQYGYCSDVVLRSSLINKNCGVVHTACIVLSTAPYLLHTPYGVLYGVQHGYVNKRWSRSGTWPWTRTTPPRKVPAPDKAALVQQPRTRQATLGMFKSSLSG